MNYFALFYNLVDDYLDRRPKFREEHLNLAKESSKKGDLILAEVDDIRLAVRDETLSDAGRVGLWTKADARTHFDTLSVTGVEAAPCEDP